MSDIIVHDSNRICILELTLDPSLDSDLIHWLSQPDIANTLRHAKRAAALVCVLREVIAQNSDSTAIATLEALVAALRPRGTGAMIVRGVIEVGAEDDDDPIMSMLAECRQMVGEMLKG